MNNFDTAKFFLGTLCRNVHQWDETNQSLRYKCSGECKKCVLDKSAKWHKANPDSASRSRKKHYKKNREALLTKTKLWQRKNAARLKLKLQAWNQSAEGKQKKYDYTKTEKGRMNARITTKKRRAIMLAAHHTEFTDADCKERIALFNGMCVYCGEPSTCLDHFLPLSKGGTHTLSNLLPSCTSCNAHKSSIAPDVWYRRQAFFTTRRWNRILKALGKTNANLNQLPLF